MHAVRKFDIVTISSQLTSETLRAVIVRSNGVLFDETRRKVSLSTTRQLAGHTSELIYRQSRSEVVHLCSRSEYEYSVLQGLQVLNWWNVGLCWTKFTIQ